MSDKVATNPFFTVSREELNREDGTDTGYDALYRKEDGQQLSVVSRNYGLVTHQEAVDFAHRLMEKAGLEPRPKFELASNGAKMFARYEFPEFKFNASKDTGVQNTALDGKPQLDDIVPEITVKNSYDKSTTVDFDGGGKRLVCENGMMVRENVAQIRISHVGEVDLERYAPQFLDQVVSVVNGIKDNYARLNTEGGKEYAKQVFLEQVISLRYQRMALEQLSPYLTVDYEKDEDGRTHPMDIAFKKDFSAYLLYCVLTEIATHRTRSVLTYRRMQQAIASQFLK